MERVKERLQRAPGRAGGRDLVLPRRGHRPARDPGQRRGAPSPWASWPRTPSEALADGRGAAAPAARHRRPGRPGDGPRAGQPHRRGDASTARRPCATASSRTRWPRELRNRIQGIVATTYNEIEQRIDIAVRLPLDQRYDLAGGAGLAGGPGRRQDRAPGLLRDPDRRAARCARSCAATSAGRSPSRATSAAAAWPTSGTTWTPCWPRLDRARGRGLRHRRRAGGDQQQLPRPGLGPAAVGPAGLHDPGRPVRELPGSADHRGRAADRRRAARWSPCASPARP